jgi:hypothetical protein
MVAPAVSIRYRMEETGLLETQMDANLAALPAALAASVGVYAHGIVGYRWMTAQLRSAEMQPTALSARLFGPGDVSWQVFGVTWHVVTAVFLSSAVALYLSAFGALESRDLLRFIAILYAAFLVVGFAYTRGRPRFLRGPIPPIFFTAMLTAAASAWIASHSV